MHSALRGSGAEARLLGDIFDAIDDVVYALDEDGNVAFWNDQLEATTGYSSEELATLEPEEWLQPGRQVDGPGPEAVLEAVGDRRVVLDLVTEDGEAIPHELRGTTIDHPETDERFLCGIARDVSDQLARQEELERYETIVESVGDGVYILDDDLTFEYVNDALCEMFGVSRERLLGADPREFFAHDDELALAADVRQCVVEGEQSTGEVGVTAELPTGERRDLSTRYRLLEDPDDGDFPGSAGIIRDVTERNRREQTLTEQRELLRAILNAIPDVVFAFDTDFEPLESEFLMDEFAGYTAEELAEVDPLEFIPEDRHEEFATAMAEVLETGDVVTKESALLTKDGEHIPYEFRATRLGDEDEVRGVVGSGRDITERVEREQALEQRTEELATLNRINELLLEVTRELVEEPSRRDLERAVCERLAESPLYRFAWIGEREVDGDGLASRVSAGADAAAVDALDDAGEDGVAGPAARPLETGEIQVLNVDDPAFEPWRETAEAQDVRAIIAVPLVHGEAVYGVLVVHATRADAFSEREQAGFRILGETVGFVINAVKRRKLLFADAVTELEFEIDDGTEDSLLAHLSAQLSCYARLDGYVDAGEEWLVYLDVDGASADEAIDVLSAFDRTSDVRAVAEGDGDCRIEVTLGETVLIDAAEAIGATVTDLEATNGAATLLVDVPAEADVRETVELLTERFPGADLQARRERDRPARRLGTPSGVLEELTDRQREAVSVAYRAGYFEWPRESSAEDIAATLDIAAPTLHAHLRKAQRRLLAGLMDPE